MAIKGLTDYDAKNDRRIVGRIEVKVFKGARKGTIERNNKVIPVAGKSLDQFYRIVTDNQHARRILKAAYGNPDQNGDFITDTIHVYFPFDEPERTFNTSMKGYSASKLLRICDREFITMESGTVTDAKGNVHNVQSQCQKPCPVAGKQFSEKCPLGCSQQGEFLFYIKEMFDADMMVPAQMTVHSFADITYISDRLDQFAMQLGSITDSPFPSFKTRHKIPFILTKSKIKSKRPVMQNGKRTGKNAEKDDWVVAFDPDSEWMNLRRNWQYSEQLKNMQISLPAQVAVKLLRGDNITEAELLGNIDSHSNSNPHLLLEAEGSSGEHLRPIALPQSETITKEQWKDIENLFIQEGWSKSAIKNAVFSFFNIERVGEIPQGEVKQLTTIAQDPAQKKYWGVDGDKVLSAFYEAGWSEEAYTVLLQEQFGITDDLSEENVATLHTLINIAQDNEQRLEWESKATF